MSKQAKTKSYGGVQIKGMAKFNSLDKVVAEGGMIIFHQKGLPPVRLLPHEAVVRIRSFLENGTDDHMSSEVRLVFRELAVQVYEAYKVAKAQQARPADKDTTMVGNLDNGKFADDPSMDINLSPIQAQQVRAWKLAFPWITGIELGTVVRSAHSLDQKEGMLREINQERAAEKKLSQRIKRTRASLEDADNPLLASTRRR